MDNVEQLRFDTKTETASGSYQEFGLSGITKQGDSGLTAATTYKFKINAIEYTILTGSGTVTWQNLIDLMQAEIPSTMTIYIVGGDLRVLNTGSSTAITAGTSNDLLAALTSTPDTQVQNVPFITFSNFNARRNILKQIRIDFSITFTGTLYWIFDKKSGSNMNNQVFDSGALSGVDYYSVNETQHDKLPLYMQSGDSLIFYTSAACAGDTNIELGYIAGNW